jgi:hypothetical protein
VVAKHQLAASVRASREEATASAVMETPDKRQCVRQQDALGELADEAGGRPKGMSIYLLDLNETKLYTRNKTDIAQREENLGFILRAIDKGKMDYSNTTDLVLQSEVYRSMLCEQGDTRGKERHSSFIACGLISWVQGLKAFSKTEKLKFLVVLKEGTIDATLTLEDFSTGEKIASEPFTCPVNNSGGTEEFSDRNADSILGRIR